MTSREQISDLLVTAVERAREDLETAKREYIRATEMDSDLTGTAAASDGVCGVVKAARAKTLALLKYQKVLQELNDFNCEGKLPDWCVQSPRAKGTAAQ